MKTVCSSVRIYSSHADCSFIDDFDPNDLFNPQPTDPRSRESHSNDDTSSDESMTTAAVFNAKPVAYAYDAYEERQKELKRLKEEEERGAVGGSVG